MYIFRWAFNNQGSSTHEVVGNLAACKELWTRFYVDKDIFSYIFVFNSDGEIIVGWDGDKRI